MPFLVLLPLIVNHGGATAAGLDAASPAAAMGLLANLGPTAAKTLGAVGLLLVGGRTILRRWVHGAVRVYVGGGGMGDGGESMVPCGCMALHFTLARPAARLLLCFSAGTTCTRSLCRLFELVAAAKSDETFIALCLLCVIGASLLTQRMGFSDTLGAFAAGVLLSETNFKTQVGGAGGLEVWQCIGCYLLYYYRCEHPAKENLRTPRLACPCPCPCPMPMPHAHARVP